MKQLFKEIKEWKHGYVKYLRYSYKFTLWLYLTRWRKLKKFFEKHFDIFLRLSFILLGFALGILLNTFGGNIFTQDILSNYLVTVGAMSGSAIAIVFTISIFLLQGAADLYSSQYFEIYIHDWKEKIIFLLVIIITILFFGAGLYVGGLESIPDQINSFIVLISLTLIGTIFALIDWQYKIVRQKINPTKAIQFLEKRSLKFLSRVQSDAKKIAKVIMARDGTLSENEALAKTYNYFLQPYIDNLDRQLENLVEISLKLADRQEVETPKRGFMAVHNILDKFLEVRKTSSVIIPSNVAFFAVESDSQRFLFNNFDRLNKAGEKFIKEGKDENATFFLRIYDSLARKAKDITYIGRSGENPILENIIGCLKNYIDIGIRAKNLEVVFQSIDKLGNIALIASEVGLTPTLIGIQNNLEEMAIFGITEKQTIVIDQCNINFLKIIGSVFISKKVIAKHEFRSILKHIATIAHTVFIAQQSGYLPKDFNSDLSMVKAYDDIFEIIAQTLRYYRTLTTDQEKDNLRSNISEFFEALYENIRILSENIKHCDNLLAECIGRLLFEVNDIIIQLIGNEEFADEKDNLRKWLGWNIHLPSWFTRYAEKFDAGSNNFRSLMENVAKTGILAANKLEDKELVADAIDCLDYMTVHALNKGVDKHGYDEPRIIKMICYLGIIALKKGWVDIFEGVLRKIIDFDPKYIKKYFSKISPDIDPETLNPRKDQLYIELIRWRENFDHEQSNRGLRIGDDAESMMYSLVDVSDIDRFIYKVWHKWLANSPINDEIEKEIEETNKKITIKRIIKTLKLRAGKLSQ